jgi:hypothetical protein
VANSNFYKDFTQVAKIVFERLQQQNNKRTSVNSSSGSSGTNGNGGGSSVTPPYYPELPEYPCKIIRDATGKVTEVQYGETPRGYVWRQILVRGTDGKLDYIKQENPDGSFNIVFHRDTTTGKVEEVDIE